MEVRPGYKQTEVGVIPEDWELQPLNKLTTQIIDGTHHTPRYVDLGVPFLRVTDIQGSEISFSDLKYISREEHQVLRRRCNPEKGDLLLSKNGTIGIPKIVSWDWEFSIFVSLALLKLKTERINARFLEQFFRSDFLGEQIRQRSKQGTVTNLHLEEIREFLIPLPPTLAEQRAIAEVLSDVDALIDTLDRLIAKKRAIKQGAMQQLLTGQTRLPRFAKASAKYKQTEVGVIPEDWDVVQIDEVASVKTGPFGSSLHESDYVQDGTPIITVEHLGEFGIMHSNLPMVSDFDRNRLRAYSLQKHDIVFSRVGSVDRNALVSAQEDGWLFSGRLLRIRPKIEGVFSPYLSYHFHDEPFKQRVRSVAVGQTMPSLNTQIMKNVVVALPPLPEQRTIAAVLSDMDAEIAALEARRDKTRALKQGMMQELLTGRTRLV